MTGPRVMADEVGTGHNETGRASGTPHPGVPDGRLLEFLVCPVTRGPLKYDAARQELISRDARLAYPIRDGIAILVPDEARDRKSVV